MSEDTIQLAAAQTGERIRTARKTYASLEVHEQYVVPDNPWTTWGAYYFAKYFTGTTGSGTTGVLSALLHPTGGSSKGVVVESVTIGWFNEGTANNNYISLQRTTGLPAANTPESNGSIGPKTTLDPTSTTDPLGSTPSPTAEIYTKPTSITIGSLPSRQVMPKSNTAGAWDLRTLNLSDADSPFYLDAGEALAIVQASAGTTTETWFVAWEWAECTL